MEYPIIGITGKRGVGKSFLAAMLECGSHAVIRSFATPIYQSLSILTGKPVQWLKMNKNAPVFAGLTVGRALQKLSDDFKATLGDDVFVRVMERETMMNGHLVTDIIIDDVRYNQEAEWVRDNGGVVIHVSTRFDTTTGDSRCINHNSERGVDVHVSDVAFENTFQPGCFVEQINYLFGRQVT